MELVKEYQRSSFVFALDMEVLHYGKHNTTAGKLLSRSDVLTALREREDKRWDNDVARMDHVRAFVEKRTAREEMRDERERAKRDETQRMP